MTRNKNSPSNHPLYRKRQRVDKELKAILMADGYWGLFREKHVRSEREQQKWDARKVVVAKQALELGLFVPQSFLDDLEPEWEENPKVPDEDDTGPPF